MELIIYVNDEFEDEKALFDLKSKKVLVKGDQYHDSIRGKIEGYLEALNDFEIYCDEVEDKWIDCNHEHFNLVGFYSE
ncbi:hypothetical protein ACU1JV_00390 [Paenibacillus sp. T2-29]